MDQRHRVPAPTQRLAFRQMTTDDLDCGLTPQEVDGTIDVEVGYHVRADLQGHGYATEAAAACRDHARDTLGTERLIAIIRPDNVPSQRVAEKIGLSHERDAAPKGRPVRIYATTL